MAYPYQLHGVDVATLLAPNKSGDIRVVRAKRTDVDQLRSAYDSLLKEVCARSCCASFACGGIVFLNYIVGQYCKKKWGSARIRELCQADACEKRFHLLPSTTWQIQKAGQVANCERILIEWLASVHENNSIILVDTSFTGGGIRNIRRVITEAPPTAAMPKDILLCGIIDRGRYGVDELPPNETVHLSTGSLLTIRWQEVPCLISEDVVALLGYSRCKLEVTLKPEWPETALILNVDEDNAINFATFTAAAVFSDLLLDWNHRVQRASTFPTKNFDKVKFVAEVKELRAALSEPR